MKYPIDILSADIGISAHLANAHIARRHAYLDLGHRLAFAIANKAFQEPTIIRAGWVENRDPVMDALRIRASIHIMPFKDWAVENLRAGQEAEWGRILEVPLTNERIMLYRDSFLYTK